MTLVRFKKRIVIDETCNVLRIAIQQTFHHAQVVAVYPNHQDAIASLNKDSPDLFILDFPFSDRYALDIIKIIKEKKNTLDVIVTLDNTESELFFDLIRRGVVSIVSLKEGLYGFLDAVKAVLNGGAYFSSRDVRTMVEFFLASPASPLSNRETEVLQLITSGKSYSEIAEDLCISKETSKTHIRNIYKKLQVTSKSAAVRIAFEEKLVAFS